MTSAGHPCLMYFFNGNISGSWFDSLLIWSTLDREALSSNELHISTQMACNELSHHISAISTNLWRCGGAFTRSFLDIELRGL